jgi:hypothetical protein
MPPLTGKALGIVVPIRFSGVRMTRQSMPKPKICRVRVFSLLSEASLATSPPVLAFKEAAVSDVQWPGDSKLLISSNNFIKNSLLFSADPSAAAGSNATLGIFLLSANMKNGTTFALSRIQVSQFFYQGDGDYLAHA